MRNSDDFDKDSIYLGLSIGAILGVILTLVAVNYGVEKQRQTECKELDGIQICRDIDYSPWKVKEASK